MGETLVGIVNSSIKTSYELLQTAVAEGAGFLDQCYLALCHGDFNWNPGQRRDRGWPEILQLHFSVKGPPHWGGGRSGGSKQWLVAGVASGVAQLQQA